MMVFFGVGFHRVLLLAVASLVCLYDNYFDIRKSIGFWREPRARSVRVLSSLQNNN